MNGNQINFNEFVDFLNEHLGDKTSHLAINKLFNQICDPNQVKIIFNLILNYKERNNSRDNAKDY